MSQREAAWGMTGVLLLFEDDQTYWRQALPTRQTGCKQEKVSGPAVRESAEHWTYQGPVVNCSFRSTIGTEVWIYKLIKLFLNHFRQKIPCLLLCHISATLSLGKFVRLNIILTKKEHWMPRIVKLTYTPELKRTEIENLEQNCCCPKPLCENGRVGLVSCKGLRR